MDLVSKTRTREEGKISAMARQEGKCPGRSERRVELFVNDTLPSREMGAGFGEGS